MKRKLLYCILTVISAVCLCFCIAASCGGNTPDQSTANNSEEENTEDNSEDDADKFLIYTLSGDGTYYIVSGCNASAISVEIPSTYNDIPVTAIGDSAFTNCKLLQSVTIADSIKSIGSSAFAYCASLVSVVVPDSVITIGSSAFSGCDLESITIPFVGSSAENAEYNYFGYLFGASSYKNTHWVPSSLTTVVITQGYDIADYAFYCCDMLESVYIADGATSIGSSAFYGCTSLTNIILPDSVTIIGNSAFSECSSLESITLPNGVTTISDSAFCDCKAFLTITIPQSVTSIGDYAFSGCDRLVEVCNLSLLKIVAGSRAQGYVGYYAVNVYTPNEGESHLFTQGDFLFIYDNDDNYYLVSYSGTDSIVVLPELTFSYSIRQYAFYCNTEITSVEITDKVTAIGDYSFDGCTSLKEIIIPDSVITIGNYAFRNCTSATKLSIGCGITNIGSSAFHNCTGLTEIYYNVVTLDDLSSSNYIFYEAGEESTGIKLTIGSEVKNIPAYLFCPYIKLMHTWLNITEIVFDNNCLCESIGGYSFAGCKIKNITIPDSVASIGRHAFDECYLLTAVNFSENSQLEYLGAYAFYGCTSLKEIIIPINVSIINEGVFFGCHSLETFTIPSNVTSIEYGAFDDCYSLESIIIPSAVTCIGANAFYACDTISITFENTEGWYYQEYNGSNYTELSSDDLSDSSIATSYLKSTYSDYYWYRSEN